MTLVFAAFVGVGSVSAQAHFTLTERNLLTGKYDSAAVAAALIDAEDFHPYPTIHERTAWDALPEAVRKGQIAEAESLLGTSWPELPATVFLEYARNGNRSNFQKLTFARREMLAKLVLGEVFEDKGRFLDDIVNGIWAISEETYWGIPAHLDIQSAGPGLPDVDEPTVDLFAAETAQLMTWTLYLLGDKLDSVSPLVRPRIRSELKRRILDPNLEHDDFWWMALHPSVINNWTPWVNSNWLTTVLIAEDEPARRSAAVYKIMRSMDVFINSYPDDGGCDEGPGYWGRAPGSMLEVLELLRLGTNGLVDIYDEPLIREMGRYIEKGYIAGDIFINFADAHPKAVLPPAVVFRYGQRIHDESLTDFGAYFAHRQGLGSGYLAGRFGHLGRQLLTLFALDEMLADDTVPAIPRDVWLPDIQVMTARAAVGSTDGLILAAKGGHNAENHNHNDVGSFMIYADGEPVIIDLGPGTYTRQTFSEDRYSIWTFQSQYHNTPTIDGYQQPAGAEYRATNVEHRADDDQASLSMDLKQAYPPEAAIDSWMRTVTLERSAGVADAVTVTDEFKLGRPVLGDSTSLNFMTDWMPTGVWDDYIELSSPTDSTAAPLYLRFDAEKVRLKMTVISIDDPGLQSSWGSEVRRIVLILKEGENPTQQVETRFTLRNPARDRD